MPKIEPYAAPNVYDPPMYSQAVKVDWIRDDPLHRWPSRLRSRRDSDACGRFQGASTRGTAMP